MAIQEVITAMRTQGRLPACTAIFPALGGPASPPSREAQVAPASKARYRGVARTHLQALSGKVVDSPAFSMHKVLRADGGDERVGSRGRYVWRQKQSRQ
jgi:hypothetical protein